MAKRVNPARFDPSRVLARKIRAGLACPVLRVGPQARELTRICDERNIFFF